MPVREKGEILFAKRFCTSLTLLAMRVRYNAYEGNWRQEVVLRQL
jgi:hypothetical protein